MSRRKEGRWKGRKGKRREGKKEGRQADKLYIKIIEQFTKHESPFREQSIF